MRRLQGGRAGGAGFVAMPPGAGCEVHAGRPMLYGCGDFLDDCEAIGAILRPEGAGAP